MKPVPKPRYIKRVKKILCLPGDNRRLKKKCVELAKKICRMGGTCIKCGRTKAQGFQIHAAHILPVTYANTCADMYNLIPLCAACHSVGGRSAHQNPHEFVLWFEKMFPGRYQLLQAIAYTKKKNDWAMIYVALQQEEKLKKFGN